MVTYEFVWDLKDGVERKFKVHCLTDDECVKTGHEVVESYGGEVLDYYLV